MLRPNDIRSLEPPAEDEERGGGAAAALFKLKRHYLFYTQSGQKALALESELTGGEVSQEHILGIECPRRTFSSQSAQVLSTEDIPMGKATWEQHVYFQLSTVIWTLSQGVLQ